MISSLQLGQLGRGGADVPDPSWANVVFLAGFNGSDGDVTYTEESSNARVATFFGNAQLDNSLFKFPPTALLLDGTGDYVTFPDSADWRLVSTAGENFTLDIFAVFTTSTPPATTQSLAGHWNSTGNQRCWLLTANSNGSIVFFWSTDGTSTSFTNLMLINNIFPGSRYAFRIDYDGTNIRTYVNGTMTTKVPFSSTFFNSTAPLSFGAAGGGTSFWPGTIDEVRITKGVARTASDAGYTVSNDPFPRF